jgi:hypothetical protein
MGVSFQSLTPMPRINNAKLSAPRNSLKHHWLLAGVEPTNPVQCAYASGNACREKGSTISDL